MTFLGELTCNLVELRPVDSPGLACAWPKNVTADRKKGSQSIETSCLPYVAPLSMRQRMLLFKAICIVFWCVNLTELSRLDTIHNG